jgi:hypothetical protein
VILSRPCKTSIQYLDTFNIQRHSYKYVMYFLTMASSSNTTLLKQEEKNPLTLKDIAPKWALRLSKLEHKFPLPMSLTWIRYYYDLDHPSKCVVGEAYGHSHSYQKECTECDRLGWEFGGSFLARSKSGLQKNSEAFVHHWNEKHIP